MAKKDWKKHFLRMKQLANQNLGRYVKVAETFAGDQLLLLLMLINGMNQWDVTVHNCMGACVAYCYRCSVVCLCLFGHNHELC